MDHLRDPIAADRPSVIDEAFDGEAVVVHLRTGFYYALNPAASIAWQLLKDGRSPAAVARLVAERHAVDEDVVATRLAGFVARLRAEELVVAAPAEAPPPTREEIAAWVAAEPELQRFNDMQELLMLDPIHDLDLDRSGWPVGHDGTPVEPAA